MLFLFREAYLFEKNPVLERAKGIPVSELEIAAKLKTPTTHIFKPQIGELSPGMSFSDSVENEWLCAEIVRAFGLPVANCSIETFDDVKVLVVERFDRIRSAELIVRLPQEDLCQALSIPNFNKYETKNGPGIIQIMDLLNESNERDKDRRIFMKAQVVFFLLAAIEGHAKNFSIGWLATSPGFSLTPLYDILSAQPMIDAKKFDPHKLKMSMAVGESRHYNVNKIFKRHFLEIAKLSKFDPDEMENIIQECIKDLPMVIRRVTSKLDVTFPNEIAQSILNGMVSRVSHLN